MTTYAAMTFEHQIALLLFSGIVNDFDGRPAIPAPDSTQDSFFRLGPDGAPEQLCFRTEFLRAHDKCLLLPND
jgi:hypothetical protein